MSQLSTDLLQLPPEIVNHVSITLPISPLLYLRINIMDNIMERMEKYALNLERTVNERTLQLVEEKKKTDRMLYRMLPSYVDILIFYIHI